MLLVFQFMNLAPRKVLIQMRSYIFKSNADGYLLSFRSGMNVFVPE